MLFAFPQLLAVHLRDRDLVTNRTCLRSCVDKLLHPRDVHPRSFYSEGAHYGFRKFANAFMALGGLVALVRIDMDPGGSQCIRELAYSIVLAERYYSDSRSIQPDRLLLHQWQSEEKFVSEFIKMYGQKDTFAGRKHG